MKKRSGFILFFMALVLLVLLTAIPAYAASITEIKAGETKTIAPYSEANENYLKFVPAATGQYVFYSKGTDDTTGELLNSSFNVIAEDDDSGLDYNFYISMYLSGGETYYLRPVALDDKTTKITVSVAKDPVKSIDLLSLGSLSYYEHCGGFWVEGYEYGSEEGVSFYRYDLPYEEKILIKYTDGSSKYASIGEIVGNSEVVLTENQQDKPWEKGKSNSFTVSYGGHVVTSYVTIKANPVKSISISSAMPTTIVKDDAEFGTISTRYNDETNGIDEFFYYYIPVQDLKVKINYTDGTSKIVGDNYAEGGQSLIIYEIQTLKPWDGPKEYYYVDFFGKTAQVPAYIANEKTGLFYEGSVYLYNKGEIRYGFTEMYKHLDGKQYYIKSGVWEKTKTGLFYSSNSGKTMYITNGVLDTGKNGLVKNSQGKYIYINKGFWDKTWEGMYKNSQGKWLLVKEGVWKSDYTGLYQSKTSGKVMYITKGVLDTEKTGLVKNSQGKYIYINKGYWDKTYESMYKNSQGKWLLVKEGVWKTDYTGLYQSKTSGKVMYITKGVLDTSVTELKKNSAGKWLYIKGGQWQSSFTGIYESKAGNKFYIKSGYWQSSFSGTITYNGKTYTIKAGKAV